MNWKNWYETVRYELTGYGLWMRGGELNTLPPEEFEARDFRALFVRLSTYFDTGYSFTHQILYQIAAGTPGVFPDLGYLPPKGDLQHFEKAGVPWLLGTQTKRDASEFDVIGFSNSIVQELVNVPSFLKSSGIPLTKSERMNRADLPIIIMGGANALYSSSLWSVNRHSPELSEPLIDGVFVGESDREIRRLLEICRDGKRAGKSKREILAELSQEVQGFFEPEHVSKGTLKARKGFIPNLNQSEALEAGPVYYLEDQLGNSHLQISEGCPCFCSFCAESWDRKPYRERSASTLKETALRAKAAMGLERIDIYSFNFNMHSELYQVLWDLSKPFRNVGLKSQRFDLLAHDPEMIEFQHALEKASITCGLEGISPRLRKYLHKNLEDEQLHKSISAIFKSRARELKMFLIATGLEEEQDFQALDDFLEHFKKIQRDAHAQGARVIFSMTPLVRFPWTPLEFEDGYSTGHYDKILEKTAKRVRKHGFEFRESADLPEYWVSQVLVRAADWRVTKALVRAVEETRYVYYRDVSWTFKAQLERELELQGLREPQLIGGFTLEESRTKPWASIETGVKREFLWEEVQRARLYKEIDYCLGRKWTAAKCFHCGGCPTRFHVRDIVLSRQDRKYSLDEFKARIREARQSEVEMSFLVKSGPRSRGVPRKLLGVALARALMQTAPELAEGYRGCLGSYWMDRTEGAELYSWIDGDDLIRLAFQVGAAEEIQALSKDEKFLRRVNAILEGWGHFVGLVSPSPTVHAVHLKYDLGAKKWFDVFKPDAFLKAHGLKYVYKKLGGAYVYELTGPSIKKDIVLGLMVREPFEVLLLPGRKLDVADFAEKSFAERRSEVWKKITIESELKTVELRALEKKRGHGIDLDAAESLAH